MKSSECRVWWISTPTTKDLIRIWNCFIRNGFYNYSFVLWKFDFNWNPLIFWPNSTIEWLSDLFITDLRDKTISRDKKQRLCWIFWPALGCCELQIASWNLIFFNISLILRKAIEYEIEQAMILLQGMAEKGLWLNSNLLTKFYLRYCLISN